MHDMLTVNIELPIRLSTEELEPDEMGRLFLVSSFLFSLFLFTCAGLI